MDAGRKVATEIVVRRRGCLGSISGGTTAGNSAIDLFAQER
jgi:hypothetical protein